MMTTTKASKVVNGIIDRYWGKHMLTQVWGKEGAKAFLTSSDNLKHHAVLSRFYAFGSKGSESFNPRPADVDSNRDLLINCNASEKRDSPDQITEGLRDHCSAYYPLEWVTEGQETSTKFSEQSLQSIMKQAVAKAKSKKLVSLHWLKRCFSAYLPESGTDLRHIQSLLRHKSIKTTEIYNHVSTKSLQKIRSPFR